MANLTINVNTGIKILYSNGLLFPAGGNTSNYIVAIPINGGVITSGDILFIEARFHRISGTAGSIFLDFSIETSASGFTNLATLNSISTSQYTGTSKHIIGVKTSTQIGGLLPNASNPYSNTTTGYTTYTIPDISNLVYIKIRLRNGVAGDVSQFSHLAVGLIKQKI